jgi:hypothetical protein
VTRTSRERMSAPPSLLLGAARRRPTRAHIAELVGRLERATALHMHNGLGCQAHDVTVPCQVSLHGRANIGRSNTKETI